MIDWDLERAAIMAAVAKIELAQQEERVSDFMSVIHADATFVLASGRRLLGWDAIAEQSERALPGSTQASKPWFVVEDVRFFRTDVAVVSVVLTYVQPDGRPDLSRHSGLPTYTFVKEGDVWKLAAGQNTYVIPP